MVGLLIANRETQIRDQNEQAGRKQGYAGPLCFLSLLAEAAGPLFMSCLLLPHSPPSREALMVPVHHQLVWGIVVRPHMAQA